MLSVHNGMTHPALGPIKAWERIIAKTLPGGDYYSNDSKKQPFCQSLKDPVRARMHAHK